MARMVRWESREVGEERWVLGWGDVLEFGLLQAGDLGREERDGVTDIITFDRETKTGDVPAENKIIKAFEIHDKRGYNRTEGREQGRLQLEGENRNRTITIQVECLMLGERRWVTCAMAG